MGWDGSSLVNFWLLKMFLVLSGSTVACAHTHVQIHRDTYIIKINFGVGGLSR